LIPIPCLNMTEPAHRCMVARRQGGQTMELILPPGSSYGSIVRRRSVAGLTLTETTYPDGSRAPSHPHDTAFLYMALVDGYVDRFGRTELAPQPHTFVFHPAGEEHSHRWEAAGGRCFNVDLPPSWLQRIAVEEYRLDAAIALPEIEVLPIVRLFRT